MADGRSEFTKGAFADNAFVCGFNLRSVSRHRLISQGGSFCVESEPFLRGDAADFHPTDVIEDADGSLRVVDTGGWYKRCCPTSQLEKPAVTGGVYRIRKAGGNVGFDPCGLRLPWSNVSGDALAARLASLRLRRLRRPPASGPCGALLTMLLLQVAAVETLPAGDPAAGERLCARYDAARRAQRGAYERLLATLPAGDATRGHHVFLSNKTACITCHAMAYAGGRVGPASAASAPATTCSKRSCYRAPVSCGVTNR